MARVVVISDNKQSQRRVDRANRGTKIRSYQGTAKQWSESGKWVTVKSSNVHKIRYDRHQKRLYVKFLGGSVYQYDGVARNTAEAMFMAPSLGKFVWRRLRGRFPYQKVDED